MARDDNDDGSGGAAVTGSTVWWAAGGVIVLVLVGLVWILINRGGSTPAAVATRTVTAPAPNPSGAGAPPATASPSTPTSTGATSGCNVPGANTLVPTTAIPATWHLVGSLAAPVSLSAGPKKITGPGGTLRFCYQGSPTGAVIAALNIAVAGTTSNEQNVIEQGFTPGPGKDAAKQQPADAGNGSISGYQVQACTQSACLVKVVFTVQGQYVEQTMPMTWSSGDWKVNGQVTGVAQAVQVASLAPYVAMSANGSGS